MRSASCYKDVHLFMGFTINAPEQFQFSRLRPNYVRLSAGTIWNLTMGINLSNVSLLKKSRRSLQLRRNLAISVFFDECLYSVANSGNSTHLRVCQDSMPFSANCTPFAPARSVHGNGSSATTCRRNNSHCARNAFS